MKTIDAIITHTLADSKRITIPSFGTLLHRSDGTLAFSEMLSDDDGILRDIVAREQNTTPDAASEHLAEFVLELRLELTSTGHARIEGVGRFTKSANGALIFNSTSNSEATPQPRTPRRRPAPKKDSSDWIMKAAIIAAIVAILVMLFGLFQNGLPQINLFE